MKAHTDPFLEQFFEAQNTASTSASYRMSFEKYFFPFLDQFEHEGMKFETFKQVVDAVSHDNALPIEKKTLLGRLIIKDFAKFMEGKLAPTSINNRVGAVQSAGQFWGVTLSTKYAKVPMAIVQTESWDWSIQDVELFNGLLNSKRYRALDAVLFQSGLAIKEALNITWGKIRKDFEAGRSICFPLMRDKTHVAHRACFRVEAIQLLRAYFEEEGYPSGDEAKIFPMGKRSVDDVYISRAKKLLGSWKYNNPMSPHSKRKAFRKFMVAEKCPTEYVEYLMGHNLDADIKKIYSAMGDDGWREIYNKHNASLSFKVLSFEDAEKLLKKHVVNTKA